MLDKKWTIVLVVLTVILLTAGIKTTGKEGYESVINSLSIGFVVSSIFYFLVVYMPEYKRKKMVLETLKSQYTEFKLSCIDTFLILSDSQEYKNREELLNLSEFRRYFKNNNKRGENRWDAIANSLQSNEFYLKEIIYYLRMLNEEIRYTRNVVNLNDPEVFDFLNRLSQAIVRMESTEREYDDIKSFCSFLWPMFTGWNWVEGYRESDLIKDMIGRAK
ncbi:hypothetical protein [Methylobacter marinus]|uniref:hypothetical protein n=1 Tax=Methylobacter marinus TaxID=34058 RepID=UPI00037C7D12|nr:hypothetical protein [Methylobacter marinus]